MSRLTGASRGQAECGDKALRNKITSNFKHLRQAFRSFDQNKDGQIGVDELVRACQHAGINLSEAEGARLIAMISSDGDGEVSAAEFNKFFGPKSDEGGGVSSKLLPQDTHKVGEDKDLISDGGGGVSSRPSQNNSLNQMANVPDQVLPGLVEVDAIGVHNDGPAYVDCGENESDSTSDKAQTQVKRNLENKIAEKLPRLKREMKSFDYDRGGGMNRNQLRRACNSIGLDMTRTEAQELVRLFDNNNDSKISYKEFVLYFKKKKKDARVSKSVTPRPPSRQILSSHSHRRRMQSSQQQQDAKGGFAVDRC
jgi:Ca2+-binding EF-hand superfamily protein